jgi:hypothetical protein
MCSDKFLKVRPSTPVKATSPVMVPISDQKVPKDSNCLPTFTDRIDGVRVVTVPSAFKLMARKDATGRITARILPGTKGIRQLKTLAPTGKSASKGSQKSKSQVKTLMNPDHVLRRAAIASLSGNFHYVKGNREGEYYPPEINTSDHYRVVRRFVTSTPLAGSFITVMGIFGALGVVGTTTTQVRTLHSAFKVHRVTIWPPALTSSAENPVLAWNFGPLGTGGDDSYNSAIPIGALGAVTFVSSVPPKESICGDWLTLATDGTTTLFEMTVQSAGAIIDVDLECVLAHNIDDQGTAVTVTTAVVGTYYRMALDEPTTTTILPVDFRTTT